MVCVAFVRDPEKYTWRSQTGFSLPCAADPMSYPQLFKISTVEYMQKWICLQVLETEDENNNS